MHWFREYTHFLFFHLSSDQYSSRDANSYFLVADGLADLFAIPDTWGTMIAPCRFDDDSSQVRVARFRDASTPDPLATGVLAGHSTGCTSDT